MYHMEYGIYELRKLQNIRNLLSQIINANV